MRSVCKRTRGEGSGPDPRPARRVGGASPLLMPGHFPSWGHAAMSGDFSGRHPCGCRWPLLGGGRPCCDPPSGAQDSPPQVSFIPLLRMNVERCPFRAA